MNARQANARCKQSLPKLTECMRSCKCKGNHPVVMQFTGFLMAEKVGSEMLEHMHSLSVSSVSPATADSHCEQP